jgi:hypothetical protein
MGDQVTIIALSILDQAEHGSHKDQDAGCVKSEELYLPGYRSRDDSIRRSLAHAIVPNKTRYDEAPEEKDLDYETADDNVFARMQCTDCAARHYATACQLLAPFCFTRIALVKGRSRLTGTLHQERNDIPRNKYLCEPSLANDRMMFAVCNEDDAAEHHVDACGI